MCGDWYEPDEEYNSQFPRSADEGGWGIDETMYTSKLDKSSLTPDQIAHAERIAAEIEVRVSVHNLTELTFSVYSSHAHLSDSILTRRLSLKKSPHSEKPGAKRSP